MVLFVLSTVERDGDSDELCLKKMGYHPGSLGPSGDDGKWKKWRWKEEKTPLEGRASLILLLLLLVCMFFFAVREIR